MGYTFKVGNAIPVHSKDYGELYASWEVEAETSPNAPTFINDEMTGSSNSRSPSYSAWHDFCNQAGIYSLFYDERGHLHAGHPGCVIITTDDLQQVSLALEAYREKASLPPGFSGYGVFNQGTNQYDTPDEGKYDPCLARLIWLEWWMRWATENCETPAIQNT